MNDFFTWDMLGSFTGSVFATTIITEFIKEIFKNLSTQLLSYFVAITILTIYTIIKRTIDFDTLAIIPFDALLVSFTSNGTFSVLQKISTIQKK